MGRAELVRIRPFHGAPRGVRVATAIRIWLSDAARVRLVVRGPSPSCLSVGAVVSRGHRGFNRVRFFGRVPGRRLQPGLYAIEVRVARGSRSTALKALLVSVSRRGATPVRKAVTDARWSCAGREASVQTSAGFSQTPSSNEPVRRGRPGGGSAWGGVKGLTASTPRSTSTAELTEELAAARLALPFSAPEEAASRETMLLLGLLGGALLLFLFAAMPLSRNGGFANGIGRTGNGGVIGHVVSIEWRAVMVMLGTALLVLAATMLLAERFPV